jgi:hypothetical protein
MKLFTFFMYDMDGENVSNSVSQTQEPKHQEEVEKKAKPVKKPTLWQRIKSELQGWSNKDANDSAYDDTQV